VQVAEGALKATEGEPRVHFGGVLAPPATWHRAGQPAGIPRRRA